MATKEYMVFYEDLSRKTVKADTILAALQGVETVEKVIRVSLYEKDKIVLSSQVVDEEFLAQDEFRPASEL